MYISPALLIAFLLFSNSPQTPYNNKLCGAAIYLNIWHKFE